MKLTKNTYEKILKVVIPLLPVVCLLWFIFFPQYYRFGYALLILTCGAFVFVVYNNRNDIWSSFKDRKNLKTLNALTTVFLAFVIIGAINYIAYRNEQKMDLTRAKVNTLSDQTIKVLKNLKDKVHFIAFLEPATEGASFEYAMDKYKHYTKYISYEVIDPNKDPMMARNKNVTTYGTIIASLDDNEARFESLTEEDLTNAIIKLTRTGKKKIYFLSGHGERDIDSIEPEDYSSIKKIMTGQNYQAEKLNLLTLKAVPQDASVVVIAGPKKVFFEKENTALENYVKNGGSLFILSDPSSPKNTITPNQNVNKFLASYGVKLRDDIIIDPQSKLFGVTEAMPVIQSYDPMNPITAGFREVTIYPFSQSIDVSKVDKGRYTVAELCRTTPESWGATESKTGTIRFNKGKDNSGPLALCVLISDKQDRDVAVFGNASFVSNQYASHAANSDMFMNVVSYLAKDKDLIAIRPKMDEAGRFAMPGGLLVGLFTVYVLPFSILSGGVVYWYKRRKK